MKRSTQSQPLLLAIAYLGFISLGLPDTLIGVAWPSVRDHFHLRQSHVGLIFFGAGCSYFLSSFFTGRLLKDLGIIGVGRVLFGFIVERLGIDRLIRLSLFTAMAGAALFSMNISATVSASALILAGLGLAAVFPCLMTKTPERLGRPLAAHAIGFQVSAAMLGAAALPSFSGFLAQQLGLEAIAGAALAMAVSLYLLHEMLLVRSRLSAVR